MGKRELVVVGVFAGLICSCGSKTEPEIVHKSERSLANVYSTGFTSPAGACTGSTGELRVRFVLTDGEGRPIRPGEALMNQTVELDRSSISFDGQASALFEVNDEPMCSSDQDCANDGFTCQSAPGLHNPDGVEGLDRCLLPEAGLAVADTPDAVDFVADTSADQVFGVLIDQSGSLAGWLPGGSAKAWDSDGDGAADTPAVTHPQLGQSIATDAEAARVTALNTMTTGWVNAVQAAAEEGRESYFGLWSFEASRFTPVAHVPSGPWATDFEAASSAVADLANTNVTQHRANTYEAIINLLRDEYSDEAMAELGVESPEQVDKVLTVLVDGPDELRERDVATIDDVIEAARQNNVRIFIVHLDPALDDPSLLRDDPMYPQDQSPCSDDSECKNYETCRAVRGYADNVDEQVTLPQGANYDLSETYCQPARDANGRVGPIHAYARLACETQGGYIYAPSPHLLQYHMRWLPLSLDGLWEATVNSAPIQRGDVAGAQPLKLQTHMSVAAAQMAKTYEFSQLGHTDVAEDADPDAFDTRAVIFAK